MVYIGSLETVVGGGDVGSRTKIYQHDFLCLGVVEDVFVLDVSVVDLLGAAVHYSIKGLRDDGSSCTLRNGDGSVVDVREEVLVTGTMLHHHNPISFLEEVTDVSDDVLVSKVSPKGYLVWDVHLVGGRVCLSFYPVICEELNSIGIPSFNLVALIDRPISTGAKHPRKGVEIIKFGHVYKK